MTNYDDFFSFENCEHNIDELDCFGFDFGFDFGSDGFDFEYPYTKYVADLKNTGRSDEEIAKEVKETEKDLEWRLKFASIQYMQSKLHETHEIHKVLAGILVQLHDINCNTGDLDHDLTGLGHAVLNASDSITESVDKLSDED